ncbi:putative penicillin-binding protein [Fictibacillus macauensis ZFHKF-1]|uniref:Putative penicillin-binding protein n=1 Tax=Fictibacillus macauensis ZFHKF-1 TaxID=1196324 RepID=I8UFJ2_9BACL|nr:serine hydrolase domain-containing protein [Fictibacillus macauensis]EIT85665.1 putative penicillin-binding protein [Fictibacillus macauensis ZFHKF-1]
MLKKKLVSSVVILILLLIICMPATAGKPAPNKIQQIDHYAEAFFKEQRIPGASIALVHNGKMYYSKAWGVTGAHEKPITLQTPFIIGSISKSLTGLAIAKLIQDKKIQLNAPVKHYLSWFRVKDQEASEHMTIKQLLDHTSGLSYESGLVIADKGERDIGAIKRDVKTLANVTLIAKPGVKYQYSNTNFLILGAVIQAVTHTSFSRYMSEEVFRPLGMTHAAAEQKTAEKKGYLPGYQSWFGYPKKTVIAYDNGGTPYEYIAASALDLVQYMNFLQGMNAVGYLTPENLKKYTSPLYKIDPDEYYGFGLRVSYPGAKEEVVWHSGTTPDAHAEFFVYPHTGWSGVILTNKNHAEEESTLPFLKRGLIRLMNGQEPVSIPTKPAPAIQLIMVALCVMLLVVTVYLILKIRARLIRKKWTCRITGISLGVLSIIVIPLYIRNSEAPWHSIKAFAPDLAFLIQLLVTCLAITALVLLLASFTVKKNMIFK